MKHAISALLLSLVLFSTGADAATATSASDPVRHVVVFRYKEGTTPAQIQEVTSAFRALKDRIPGILAFETGVNDSKEGRSRGFTHVYVLTFSDAAARDAYLPHPEHKRFGELLGRMGVLEDVFVVDYVPGA